MLLTITTFKSPPTICEAKEIVQLKKRPIVTKKRTIITNIYPQGNYKYSELSKKVNPEFVLHRVRLTYSVIIVSTSKCTINNN